MKALGVTSSPLPLLSGVPQGSVLGPSLFNIYTSPVPAIATIHSVKLKQFSDDTQGYVHFQLGPHHQSEALNALSACAASIEDWFTVNRVKLNLVKSILLYIVPHRQSSAFVPSPLVVGDAVLPPSVQARNLGVTFDTELTMVPHVNGVCKSAFFHLTLIGRIRKYLDTKSAKSLVHALVLSRIDYANSLLVGLPKSQLGKLQRVQNAAARLVVGAGRHDRVSEHLKNLHWLPVEQRVEFKTALMTFRCLYDIAPVYLSDLVEWYKPTRELRSCNSHTIVSPSFRLAKYGGRSFHPAPSIWNALPLSVRFFLFVYPQISIRIWAWCAPVTTLKSRDCWTVGMERRRRKCPPQERPRPGTHPLRQGKYENFIQKCIIISKRETTAEELQKQLPFFYIADTLLSVPCVFRPGLL